MIAPPVPDDVKPVGVMRLSGTYVLLAIALVLAAAGQVALLLHPEWLRLPPFIIIAVQPMWPDASAAFAALIAFAVAGSVFALALRTVPGQRIEFGSVALAPLPAWPRVSQFLVGLGVAVQLWTDVRLVSVPYDPSVARWFLGSVAVILAGLLISDGKRIFLRRPVVRARHLGEMLIVLAGLAGFLWLDWFDVRSWYYASIGDEYSFYDIARQLANGTLTWNPFSQEGVYGYHPALSSYTQALLMSVLGTDLAGWKFGTAVEVAVALLGFYLLARQLFGTRAAILTLGTLCTAHYLLAFSHIGYNTLEPLLYAAGCLLAFVVGLRRGSAFLLVVAGLFAGLGWYTFYTSRSLVVILALAIILIVPRRHWLGVGAAVGGGFVSLLLPFVAVNRLAVLTSMINQTGARVSEPAANRTLLPVWNAGRSFLAFNYNPQIEHYTSGSLVEPVTAVFFALGLGFVVLTQRDARNRLLLTWYAIGLISCGVVSQYDHVSVSRLNFLVPVVCLTAALAVDRAVGAMLLPWGERSLAAGSRRPGGRAIANGMLCLAILSGVTYGNLHRWFVETPAVSESTQEALAVGVLDQSRCTQAPRAPLVVSRDLPGSLISAVVASEGRLVMPLFARYDQPTTWIDSADGRCIVILLPYDDQAKQIVKAITARWPDLHPVDFYDGAHHHFIQAMYPTTRPDVASALSDSLPAAPMRHVATLPGGSSPAGTLKQPVAVAVDGDGHIFVLDRRAKQVAEYDAQGSFLRAIASPGNRDGQLMDPVSLVLNRAGELAVLDRQVGRIDRFSRDGTFLGALGKTAIGASDPMSLAADSSGGYLVAGTETGDLLRLDADGNLVRRWRIENPLDTRPPRPVAVAVDPHGTVYVADAANNLLTAYDVAFRPVANIRLAGLDPTIGAGIAVAPDYTLYVSDPATRSILHTQLNGNVNTIPADQLGEAGAFQQPVGLAVDSNGQVYVADSAQRQILVFGR